MSQTTQLSWQLLSSISQRRYFEATGHILQISKHFSDDPLPNSISWWHLLHPSGPSSHLNLKFWALTILVSASESIAAKRIFGNFPGHKIPFSFLLTIYKSMNFWTDKQICKTKYKLSVAKAFWMKTWPVHPNYWAVGGGGGPVRLSAFACILPPIYHLTRQGPRLYW